MENEDSLYQLQKELDYLYGEMDGIESETDFYESRGDWRELLLESQAIEREINAILSSSLRS